MATASMARMDRFSLRSMRRSFDAPKHTRSPTVDAPGELERGRQDL
jgi:hypothetical protein